MVNQLHIFIRVSFFACLVLLSKSFAESPKTFFSGYVDYTYIARQSDQSLINIPYRMGSLNLEREHGDIILNSTIALEYHVREDSYFLGSSNPQDFVLDMREIYLTYSSDSYEFLLGKVIHYW